MGRSPAGAAVGVAEIYAVVWDNSLAQDHPLNPMNRGAYGVPVQPLK